MLDASRHVPNRNYTASSKTRATVFRLNSVSDCTGPRRRNISLDAHETLIGSIAAPERASYSSSRYFQGGWNSHAIGNADTSNETTPLRAGQLPLMAWRTAMTHTGF